jgi:hypothetical protein
MGINWFGWVRLTSPAYVDGSGSTVPPPPAAREEVTR